MKSFILDLETAPIANAADYLEPVTAPANYSKPESIAKYIAEETPKQLAKCSLKADLNQIIALGVQGPDGNTMVYRGDQVSETEMLTWLWEQWHAEPWDERQFVTFNGLKFDIPILLRRSLYLGVKAPIIKCDRFKHPQVVDLMTWLNMDGVLDTYGLQFYLQRFNYPHGGPDVTGKDIGALYAAGDWAAIEQHCRMDVEATAWLAERIGAVPKRQPVGEAAGAF